MADNLSPWWRRALIKILPFNSNILLLLDNLDMSELIIYSALLSLNKYIVVSIRLKLLFPLL